MTSTPLTAEQKARLRELCEKAEAEFRRLQGGIPILDGGVLADCFDAARTALPALLQQQAAAEARAELVESRLLLYREALRRCTGRLSHDKQMKGIVGLPGEVVYVNSVSLPCSENCAKCTAEALLSEDLAIGQVAPAKEEKC